MNRNTEIVKCFIKQDDIRGMTRNALKVWNGRSFSYLALTQMKYTNIVEGEGMYFQCSKWFHDLHPWLIVK